MTGNEGGCRVLAIAATVLGASLVPIPTAAQSVAITPVTVIDVRAGIARPDRTVIVRGDRITAVEPAESVEVPADARVVDGTGKYLIPGLWDMHTHSGADELTRTIVLPLYVAHGITGIRELSGKPGQLGLRAEIAEGAILGPRMMVGSPLVDGPNPFPVGEYAGQVRVADAREAREMVDSLWAEGYEFIKTYKFLSPATYRALHERAGELGMEVSGEIPMSVSLWEAAALGHRTVEHLTGVEFACSEREEELRVEFRRLVAEISADTTLDTHIPVWNRSEWEPVASWDPVKCRALYRHLAAHKTWVVPTLAIQHQISHASDPALQNDPRQRYLPSDWWDPEGTADWLDPDRQLRPTYDRRVRTLPDLHQAGVGILAGSDLPGGFPLHDELALYVESGLSPLDALRTATLNPARYLEATDSLGTVEAGKVADLVLLAANPLEDISHIQEIAAVVRDGRYLDRAALDELLADAERAANQLDAARDSVSSEDRSLAEEGQEAEVPRTRTLPGLEDAPYPYVEPAEVGLSAERLERLGDRVARWVRDSSIVGAEILVVKDRKIVLHEAMGWSDREAGEPMRRNTIYRLRSMTKPFTATAALMLVEEGKLALDAPVARWLPSWDNERSGEITVRQLLTHTAGWVQGGLPEPVRTYPNLRAAVDAAGEAGSQHPAGEAFCYSDVHSYTLGALVAEVGGMPVERFIAERILEPLGLEDTHTRFAPDTAWADRMNPTYRWEDSVWFQYWHPDSAQVAPFFRASGGLYSTVFDYARWMDAWMQWAGLIKPPTEEAAAPRLLSEAIAREAVTPSPMGAYGYHWRIASLEPLVFAHGGSDGTLATAIPSRNTLVLYFTQSRGQQTRGDWQREAFEAVAPDIEFPRPIVSLPAAEADLEPAEISVEELERYAGAYVTPGDTLTFAVEGGRLRIRWGPRVTLDGRPVPRYTLVPLGDRTFAFGRYEAGELLEVYLPTGRLRFEVEDGQVVGFRPVQGERVGPLAPKIR